MQDLIQSKCVSTLCTDSQLGPGDGEEKEAEGLPLETQSPEEDNHTRVQGPAEARRLCPVGIQGPERLAVHGKCGSGLWQGEPLRKST